MRTSLIGRCLAGKYEILELLGEGGMGAVYKALQKPIDRLVAVKVLRHELASDVTAKKRFLVEARAASQLTSQHCVRLYDFGEAEDPLLFSAMELVEGASLASVRSAGPLGAERTARVAIDVCYALEEAHAKGIVHRDIKPDNIMIVAEADRQIAKVLDFGIAKLLTNADETGLTAHGTVFGTVAYMSPEQADGQASPQSDLYSLGIVLYECLAGARPFNGKPVSVLIKHKNEQPPPLPTGTPPALDALVMQMLAKNPASRPRGAVAVRERLTRLVQDSCDLEARPTHIVDLSPAEPGLRERTITMGGPRTGQRDDAEEGTTTVSRQGPEEPIPRGRGMTVPDFTQPAQATGPRPTRSRRWPLLWQAVVALIGIGLVVLAIALVVGSPQETPPPPEPDGTANSGTPIPPREDVPTTPLDAIVTPSTAGTADAIVDAGRYDAGPVVSPDVAATVEVRLSSYPKASTVWVMKSNGERGRRIGRTPTSWSVPSDIRSLLRSGKTVELEFTPRLTEWYRRKNHKLSLKDIRKGRIHVKHPEKWGVRQ